MKKITLIPMVILLFATQTVQAQLQLGMDISKIYDYITTDFTGQFMDNETLVIKEDPDENGTAIWSYWDLSSRKCRGIVLYPGSEKEFNDMYKTIDTNSDRITCTSKNADICWVGTYLGNPIRISLIMPKKLADDLKYPAILLFLVD